jgi:hypothetical protein
MKQRKGALLLVLLLLVGSVLVLGLAPAPQYSIAWRVLGGGGGSSSNRYHLSGTSGQGIVGASSAARYSLRSGFWAGIGIREPTPMPTRTSTPVPGLPPRVWLPVVMKNASWP